MHKKYGFSIAGIIICILAVVITIFTNRNNTGFENIPPQPTGATLPIIKVKSQGVLIDNTVAVDGQSMNIGNTIKTDATGSAEIDFPSGSITRIDKNSEVTLQSFDANSGSTSVKINLGKIWSRVVKVLGKEDFQTESSNLVASVRGTSYGHEVTKEGRDIVTVSESVVNCKCKVNRVWDRDINTDFIADYDCVSGREPKITRLTQIQKLDAWYLENQETVPSSTPTIKPLSTVKPTMKPTTTPTPVASGTSSPLPTTPTPSPTVSPSPTPASVTITSLIDTGCKQNACILSIYGSGFDASSVILAIDANGKQYGPASIRGYSATSLNVYFSNLPAGTYWVKVNAVQSTMTFNAI